MLPIARFLLLLAFLVLACYWDLRERRIPNWLNFGAAIAAFATTLLSHWLEGSSSMLWAGMGIATATLLLLYLGGGVGGGDVKLAVAFGFWAGYPAVIHYLFYGGLIALALILGRLAWHGETWGALTSVVRQRPSVLKPGAAEKTAASDEGKKRSTSFALALLLAVLWVQLLSLPQFPGVA